MDEHDDDLDSEVAEGSELERDEFVSTDDDVDVADGPGVVVEEDEPDADDSEL
jgi:hypothetical protein